MNALGTGKRLAVNLVGLGAALVAGGCGAEGDRAVPQDGDRQAAVGATADQAAFDRQNVFGKGEPNAAYAKYFVGNSYLKAITDRESGFPMANVTFEPGCRNNWHVHRAAKGGGQVLIVTAGSGWYQLEGKPAVSLNPGDAVVIPANVKHWHGAKKDSWFSHIAFEVPGEGMSNEWLEPVSDEEYAKL